MKAITRKGMCFLDLPTSRGFKTINTEGGVGIIVVPPYRRPGSIPSRDSPPLAAPYNDSSSATALYWPSSINSYLMGNDVVQEENGFKNQPFS